MSFETWVYVIAIVGGLLGSVVIVISTFRRGKVKSQRGTEPGQGGSLIIGGAGGNSSSSTATTKAYVVTKDPQEYAKAFVPKRK